MKVFVLETIASYDGSTDWIDVFSSKEKLFDYVVSIAKKKLISRLEWDWQFKPYREKLCSFLLEETDKNLTLEEFLKLLNGSDLCWFKFHEKEIDQIL